MNFFCGLGFHMAISLRNFRSYLHPLCFSALTMCDGRKSLPLHSVIDESVTRELRAWADPLAQPLAPGPLSALCPAALRSSSLHQSPAQALATADHGGGCRLAPHQAHPPQSSRYSICWKGPGASTPRGTPTAGRAGFPDHSLRP